MLNYLQFSSEFSNEGLVRSSRQQECPLWHSLVFRVPQELLVGGIRVQDVQCHIIVRFQDISIVNANIVQECYGCYRML